MTTHSRILAWKISWAQELGGLQSMGSKESGTTERLTLRPISVSSYILVFAIIVFRKYRMKINFYGFNKMIFLNLYLIKHGYQQTFEKNSILSHHLKTPGTHKDLNVPHHSPGSPWGSRILRLEDIAL